MALIIREYELRDAGPLAELMGELGYPAAEEQMRSRMAMICSHPMYCTLVAELDGEVAGMIGLRLLYGYEFDHATAQISALVTKAEYRGLGIGRELVRQAEKRAKANGAAALVLTSGNRPERAGAHEFYRRLGFTESGLRFSKRL